MPSSSVIIVAFLAQITGILGASLCPALQRRLQWTNKKCLIVLVALMALLPLYGIAGLVMGGTGVGGLRTPGEMYVVAAIFGKWSGLLGYPMHVRVYGLGPCLTRDRT